MHSTMKARIRVTLFAIGMICAPYSSTAWAQDGRQPITFYDGGWENIQISNAIAIYIVKNGFGREATDVDSNVPKMQAAMENGTMDVNLEMYNNLMAEWVNAQVAAGSIVELGQTYESASQGFYVPTYVIKGDPARGIKAIAPDLKGVQDLGRYAEVFRQNDPDKEAKLVNCLPGWACREINLIKLATYGLDKELKSIEPATENELNEIVLKEYQAGRPFVTYYWAPSALPSMIDLTLLQEPAYDAGCWAAIERVLTPFQPGVAAERACAYETIPILKYATKKMVEQNPEIIAFLRSMFIGTQTMGKLAAYMHRQEASPDDTALYFLKNYRSDWEKWVPDPVKTRIADSLAR
jgi:glycine betaine/proline transport system substrate-binding protein